MRQRKVVDFLFWVALLWIFVPSSAFAYLDPGTGSFVVQVVVGSLLGVGFVLKSSWKMIKYKISQLFCKRA